MESLGGDEVPGLWRFYGDEVEEILTERWGKPSAHNGGEDENVE